MNGKKKSRKEKRRKERNGETKTKQGERERRVLTLREGDGPRLEIVGGRANEDAVDRLA
jgi:hypothetical protein